MSDEAARESQKDGSDAAESPAEVAAQPPPPAEELETLRAEVEKLRDQKLRALAEARNAQQRAQREKELALRYAEADFARDLLVVIDDLERTIDSARTAESLAPVLDGVRIIQEHFLDVLKKRGIQQIESVGQPFDPALHEALLQEPSTDVPAGVVTKELARGYRMHGRVIRAARVAVSGGPPADAGESGG
ncbi:MAG: nucleotide exchange factor GrpE [Phycisphaerae bacterium]|jgi:molecular chaperone GrpE